MTLLEFNELQSRPSQAQSHKASALVFEDPESRRLLKQIARIAPSDATVLIIGETGTGKELVARHIHALSNRSQKTFGALNCAALNENLIESELFGHQKGFSELVMVGMVALLVIGPEKLPKLARLSGYWVGKARSTVASVKAEIRHELYLEETKQLMQEVRNDGDAAIMEIDSALEAFTAKSPGNRLELLEHSEQPQELQPRV